MENHVEGILISPDHMLAMSTEDLQRGPRDVGRPPPLQIHNHHPAVEIGGIWRHAQIAVVWNRGVDAEVVAASIVVGKCGSTIDPGATHVGHGEAGCVPLRLGPE